MRTIFVAILAAVLVPLLHTAAQAEGSREARGWVSLFNGEDLTGWRVPEDGPWAVVDGTIDCDPKRSPGVRGDAWTEQEYGDFILHLEWRFTDAPTEETRPVILPDGSNKTDEEGNVVTETFMNADSGIYVRGQSKAQVNIWNWPIGSGEVWGYRTDASMPAEVREAVTPQVRADRAIGQWNTMIITMVGDRLSVMLNGQLVIDEARLPGVAEEGPIALQYHGGYDEQQRRYRPASSLIQFRNLYIRELP